MEPLSTLALVAAFMVPAPLTRRPEWVFLRSSIDAPAARPSETDQPLFATSSPTEQLLDPVGSNVRPDLKMVLQSELELYLALPEGWDGDGSRKAAPRSYEAANAFIESFPAGLPLPRPMFSASGHIGFFWDLPNGFADLSFDEDGTASFFSRSRDGVENYADELTVDGLTREWAFHSLGAVAAPVLQAA
jgi:hypothetical protein